MCVRYLFAGTMHLLILNLCFIFIKPSLGCDQMCQLIEQVSELKSKVDDIKSELNTKVDDIKDSIEKKIEGLNSKIENGFNFMEGQFEKITTDVDIVACTQRSSSSLTNTEEIKKIQKEQNSQLSSIMNTIMIDNERIDRCPGGVFVNTQCFVIMNAQTKNWEDSKELCHSKGLVLPQTSETVALILKTFMLERYGNGTYWINARGDGNHFEWGHGDMVLNNELWKPVQPQPPNLVTTDMYCLAMLVNDEEVVHNQHLYHPYECAQGQHFTLCERTLQVQETIKSPIMTLDESLSSKLQKINKELETKTEELINKQETNKGEIISTIEESQNKINQEMEIKTEELMNKQETNKDEVISKIDTVNNKLVEESNKIIQTVEESQNKINQEMQIKTEELKNKHETNKDEVISTIEESQNKINQEMEIKTEELKNKQETNKDEVISTIEESKNKINQEMKIKTEELIKKQETIKEEVINTVKDSQNKIIEKQNENKNIIQCTGGFMVEHQCFKMIKTAMSFDQASRECLKIGHLAQPTDPIAVGRIIVEKYGTGDAWIGARGTGSSARWEAGARETIANDSPLWYHVYGPSDGRAASNYCLGLLVLPSNMAKQPNQPYFMDPCSNTYYPLCQIVV